MTATTADRLDLSVPTSVHVVGVGGAGMSAIASVLAAMGHRVSGSDLKASPGLERLAAQGVKVAVGHSAGNLADDVAVVAVSTAVPERNPEVRPLANAASAWPAGPRSWRPSAPPAGRWPWPARTARPPRRRCWR